MDILISKILRLSKSDDFRDAKGLWIIECAYQSKEEINCLCGRTKIIDVVRFRKMNSEVRIQLCCKCAKILSGLNFVTIFLDYAGLRNSSRFKVSRGTLDYLIDSKRIDRDTYYSYLEHEDFSYADTYVQHIFITTMENPEHIEGWRERQERMLKAQNE